MRGKLPEPSESQIETLILHYLVRVLGVFAYKNTSVGYFDAKLGRFRKQASPYAIKGAPDIICIFNGAFVGFEVKSRTGKQSDDQKAFEERCWKARGYYFVVRSLEDVKAALAQVIDDLEQDHE